jgi:hypothetical protein
MRRWYVPLAVFGLGSLGVVLLSDRGRRVLRSLFQNLDQVPDRLLEWNDGLQHELDRIQTILDRVAESVDPYLEMGH